MQFRPVNLNEVIANLTKTLNRLIGEHIELQCACVDNLPSVRADVGMLEQVLINLVVNARDAMPEGGHVLIAMENVQIDAAYALAHPDPRPGEFVCCRVRDTGTGITKFM